MTRGQIAIITNSTLMTSIEFNGDMYLEGYGEDVVDLLKEVKDIADYEYAVAKFNKEHHHYEDCYTLTYGYEGKKKEEMQDFLKDYFEKWFSDYVYIKNVSDKEVILTTRTCDASGDNERPTKTKLFPNEIAILTFGRLLQTR